MPYDLYGNSYKTSQEALNAEMAQCAEIDNRIMRDKHEQQENNLHGLEETIHYMQGHINSLVERVNKLEEQAK